VWKCEWREHTVAVKKLLKHWISGESNSKFHEEIGFLQTIRHPNIVLFYGAGELKVCLSIEGSFTRFNTTKYQTGDTNTVSDDRVCPKRICVLHSQTRAKLVDMETEDVTLFGCRQRNAVSGISFRKKKYSNVNLQHLYKAFVESTTDTQRFETTKSVGDNELESQDC